MNEEVNAGQEYGDRRTRNGSVRIVKVVESVDPIYAVVKNVSTLRRVKIKKARLLDTSRFKLISEIGTLAPLSADRPISLAASAS